MSSKKWFGAAILGTIVGAIAGILFAPKSGRESRKIIKETVINLKDKIVESVKSGEEKVKEIATKTSEAVKAGVQTVNSKLKK